MTLELTLKSDTLLDFAFGKVIKGKEMQVFGEYFPIVAPVLEECGIQSLRSFAVLATNNPGMVPEQGALTQIPNTESFDKFHHDPRFIEAKPLRDDAMEFLTDGNFFKPSEQVVILEAQTDYALTITEDNPLETNPLLEIPAAEDSPKQTYCGKMMRLHLWNDEAEKLMSASSGEVVVFRIRFFPSGD
ncbi:hypothetical protein [Thalassomonas sp. RHCl1]|uniref:hypothetical protein n=1 Tax=Thalassomonas sp. RHCl1 TaxID=2995320 RepID=UPI00248CB152|nr:hypothetical protein [Thalassomonas sp. RHCl1]